MEKMILILLIIGLVSAQTIDEMFRVENGNEWAIEVADWGYILSVARPRPQEVQTPKTQEEAIQISNTFLEKNAKYFGIESLNYTDSALITDIEGKKSWVVVYEGQRFEGLPVMDTHTTVIMTLDGQVYAVGNLRYHFEEDVIPTSISIDEAKEKAKEVLNTKEEPIEIKKQVKAIIEQNKTKPEIFWNITYGCPINKDVLINSKGEIISIKESQNICEKKEIKYLFLLPFLVLIVFLLFSKKKRRKGIAFGLLLVTISLSLVALVLMQKEIYRKDIKKTFIENRIQEIINLFEGINYDLEKALDITAKRSIAVAESKIITTGVPLTSADQTIKELMLFGSIYGEEQPLMENSTINNWIKKIEIIGKEKGYEINISFVDFEIKPYDSFNIIIEGSAWINISDKIGSISIKRIQNISKTVSIENFEDPIYALNTNSKATRIIKKTKFSENFTQLLASCSGIGTWKYGESFVSDNPVEIINAANKSQKILVTNDVSLIEPSIVNQYLAVVSKTDSSYIIIDKVVNCSSIDIPNSIRIVVDSSNGRVWSIENLLDHYKNGYYSPSLYGPSFFDRLEGKLILQNKYKTMSKNIIGLESFIDKNYFDQIDIVVKQDTNIDYLYFNQSYFSSKNVRGMPNSFLIDNQTAIKGGHQDYYQVSELLN
ncbi:MAG: hypothetical protein KQA41_02710 [Candidatus Aenigmarchaeota archaeon]|nr:hypothetical protein [Candidatus Aenigmarchaeota archaeon]